MGRVHRCKVVFAAVKQGAGRRERERERAKPEAKWMFWRACQLESVTFKSAPPYWSRGRLVCGIQLF